MIQNVTEADLGLYYCSLVEKQIIEHDRLAFEKEVYHIGDTLTKLAYANSDDIESSGSNGKFLIKMIIFGKRKSVCHWWKFTP